MAAAVGAAPVRDVRRFRPAGLRRSGFKDGDGADRVRADSGNLEAVAGGAEAVWISGPQSRSPDAAQRAAHGALLSWRPVARWGPALRSGANAPHRVRDTKCQSSFSLNVARNGWPG